MEDIAVPVPGGSINVWHRPAVEGHPTAALIHGLTGNSRWWVEVIAHLPDEMGLMAFDARGRGRSFASPPPYDLTTLADDIRRSLRHLRLETAIVAGYSMGGWIAALFAIRHPDLVSRLIMVDGGFALPHDPDANADDIITAIVGPSLARLDIEFEDEASFHGYWKQHPALKRHWSDDMIKALDFELARSGAGYAVQINPEAIREAARQITVDPGTNQAGRDVRVRAHLIVVERGTTDQEGGMIPLTIAEEAARAMPNLTMEYLPEINHYTLLLGAGAPAVASAISHSAG